MTGMPDVATMPALTCRAPWVAAIRAGVKRVECRTRPPRNGGGWLLLHQGVAVDRDGDRFVRGLGYDHLADQPRPPGIVAAYRVDGYCDPSTPCEYGGRWALPGRYAWHITDLVALTQPVPCLGRQGYWWPTGPIVDQIRTHLPKEHR